MGKGWSGFGACRFSASDKVRVRETVFLLLGGVLSVVVVVGWLLIIVIAIISWCRCGVGRLWLLIARLILIPLISLVAGSGVVVSGLLVSLGGWLCLASTAQNLVVVVGVVVLVRAVNLLVLFFVLFQVVV